MTQAHDQIWSSALKALEIRMMSSKELLGKLTLKYPHEEREILKVIEELKRVALLNDHRYTEDFVRYLLEKPIGRLKIEIETRKRGLDSDLVDQILLELGYDERACGKKALLEKDPQFQIIEDPRRQKVKRVQYLRNRGFRDHTIYSLLRSDD